MTRSARWWAQQTVNWWRFGSQGDLSLCWKKATLRHCNGWLTLEYHSLFEFDIERSPDHDLSSDHLWTQIRDLLKVIRLHSFAITTLQHVFSCSFPMADRHPGPRPLRNVNWPKGFPWLSARTSQWWTRRTVSSFGVLKPAFSVILLEANTFGSILRT